MAARRPASTARKQRRIVRASRHLLAMQPRLARCAIRFDVLDLRPQDGGLRHQLDTPRVLVLTPARPDGAT